MSLTREQWQQHLEVLLGGVATAQRVMVVEECASTQDVAAEVAAGKPGLLVVAMRQSGGRGRLGRAWHHSEKGLAATFVLPGEIDSGRLSMVVGLAACTACAMAIGAPGRVGLRWPNDVVERAAAGRKVCGVLIEKRGGVHLVGIGVNVLQGEADWPEAVRGRACSLTQLGATTLLENIPAILALCLRDALAYEDEVLRGVWKSHDVLTARDRTFEHDGRRVSGRVEMIEPTSEIVVRTPDGQLVRLPALTTSLVHE